MGAAFLATLSVLRLQRQSRGRLKVIRTAPGNRSCAGLRGGERTPNARKCRPFRRLAAKSPFSGEEIRASRTEGGEIGASLCSVIFQYPKFGWGAVQRPVRIRKKSAGDLGRSVPASVARNGFAPLAQGSARRAHRGNPRTFQRDTTGIELPRRRSTSTIGMVVDGEEMVSSSST